MIVRQYSMFCGVGNPKSPLHTAVCLQAASVSPILEVGWDRAEKESS